MKQRMEGRKMIRVKNISSKVKNGDIEGDWVTIAVVVDKLPPRYFLDIINCYLESMLLISSSGCIPVYTVEQT